MFLTFGGVFPDGATEEDLLRHLPAAAGPAVHPVPLADGSKRLIWTTFTSQQIDIDVRQPATPATTCSVLDRLADAGVAQRAARRRRVRRQDAGHDAAFMTPRPSRSSTTSTARATTRGLEVLVEVHSHYRQQIEIARDRWTGSTTSRSRRWCCTR